jgi:hypothetical protein
VWLLPVVSARGTLTLKDWQPFTSSIFLLYIMKALLGHIVTLENTDKKSNLSADNYLTVWVINESGVEECLTLTHYDLFRARQRAERGEIQKPALKKSWWSTFFK